MATLLVWLIAVGIWLLALGDVLPFLTRSENGYSQRVHLLSGLTISALTLLTILLVGQKFQRRSWQRLLYVEDGRGWRHFLLGLLCWLLPAAVGIWLCMWLGWVTITPQSLLLQSSIGEIVIKVLLLAISIFLIEAFPEELLFRGYLYDNLNRVFPQWATFLLQALLFTFFAWMIGALNSFDQWLFIPSFGLLLGYFRLLTASIWFPIGYHMAQMTVTQLLGPVHEYFLVSDLPELRMIAFVLLPSAVSATLLGFLFPPPKWNALRQHQ